MPLQHNSALARVSKPIALSALLVCGLACGVASQERSPNHQSAKTKRRQKSTSLLLIENVAEDGVCRKRRLVRFRFRGGRKPQREVIVEREQRFFGHFGRARLVENRFVVTQFGGVIDLRSKKVVHDEEDGDVLAVDGKRVVYRIANANRDNGVFAFDLEKRSVSKIKDPHTWQIRGLRSADGKFCAVSNPLGEVWLHDAKGKRRRLAQGFRIRLSPLSSGGFSGVPMLWLDARTLLTQTDNGQLVTLGIDGTRKDFTAIDGLPLPVGCPRFKRDAAGRIIYDCHDSYVLDPRERSAKLSRWRALGHGFDYERKRNPEHGHIIRENGREIGREPVVGWNAVSANGRLAIGVATKKSPGYVTAVKTWDSTSMTWHKIELWVNDLVGWCKD